MKRRMISIILCLAILISLMPSVFASDNKGFTDMPSKEHWSYQALCAAIDNGLLQGSNGLLKPNDKLTRAQMAAIINRAFGAMDLGDISEFRDVPQDKWYRNDIAKAVRMGTLNGYGQGLMMPDAPITREQAFTVIARALKLDNGEADVLNRFSDKQNISNYAIGPLAAMVGNGYVNGSGGKINPKNSITRAEFAQVFFNVLKQYCNQAREYTQSVTGNVIVNVPGVTLKNMNIDGDLIIGEGVANGEVTLDNVDISGRMVVRGGGAHSIILKNKSAVGSVLVGKTGDGSLRIRTEEGCRIEVIKIDDGKDEVILEGEFNQVAVNTDVPVILENAEVTGLTIAAKNAEVSLTGDTSISAVQVSTEAEGTSLAVEEDAEVTAVISKAENVTVQGEGAVKTAEVSGNATVVDTKGTMLTVAEGTQGVKENGNAVEAGQTVETGDSGDFPPPPHTHDWGIGEVTTEPNCEKTGTRTYHCECGETRTEEIAALGHDWDEGTVTKEPGVDGDGEMTFRCKRCNAVKTEPISLQPFSIVINEGEENEETLWFETLDDAVEEAKKHPYYNEPGEDPWIEYQTITLNGSAVINNLYLPSGYSLFVAGNLTLNGTLTLGSSDYAHCSGKGAARLFIPMFDETTVTLNDTCLYSGTRKECVIVPFEDDENKDTEHFDLVVIYGAREIDKSEDKEDESVNEKPWIGFGGFFGEHSFDIVQDYDFTRYFDCVQLDESVSSLRISANVGLNRVEIWGSNIILDDRGADSGSISMDGRKIYGFTKDCAVQMISKGGENTPGVFVGTQDNILCMGGDLVINDDIELNSLNIRPYFESDSNSYTVTIKEGVSVTLSESRFEEAVQVINNGIMILDWNTQVLDQLVNNGELIVRENFGCENLINNGTVQVIAQKVDDEFDSYLEGRLNIQGGTLQNNGVIYLMCSGDDENCCGELTVENGAMMINSSSGTIENDGRIFISNAKLENNGIIRNDKEMEANAGYETWAIYGEGRPAQQEGFCGEATIKNCGTLRNSGNIQISGAEFENSGSITNLGNINMQCLVQVKETYQLKSVEGIPENFESWFFWDWDDKRDDGTWGYWEVQDISRVVTGIKEAELVNDGTIINQERIQLYNVCVTNAVDAEIINNRHFEIGTDDGSGFTRFWWNLCRWEATLPEGTMPRAALINAGSFVNGVITSIGEENNGSDAYCAISDTEYQNQGSITNNGNMDVQYTDYTQTKDAKFETYNCGGLGVIGGSMKVPSGAFFKNEGYMRISDQYGADEETCDLSGFEDFFTTWNQDGNDSNWCEFVAKVYDEDGYYTAVAAQEEKPEPMRYNRMDFCDDITFTRNVTLDGFNNYWIETKMVERWMVWNEDTGAWEYAEEDTPGAELQGDQVGSTLTVPKGVTLTVANNTCLYVDGDYWDNMRYIRSNRFVVEGTLIIEAGIEGSEENNWNEQWPGRVEIWGFGSFDGSQGIIRNNGYFEIRDYEFGHEEETIDGEYRYVHDGNLNRMESCPVIGYPQNAVYAADVRSLSGLKKACSNSKYNRILVRENCCIIVNEDLDLPNTLKNEVYIEPGSGLIVEYGSTLHIRNEVALQNDGDISIYGKVIVDGIITNGQNLELGAITGTQNAELIVNGIFANYGHFGFYPTGSVILGSNGEIENWEETRIPVTFAENMKFGKEQRGIIFSDALTLRSAQEESEYSFANCDFPKEVSVVYSGGDAQIIVGFLDGGNMAQPLRVYAEHVNDETTMNESIILYCYDGMRVQAQCPILMSCWGDIEVNGVPLSSEDEGYAVWLRSEGNEDQLNLVFQIDSNEYSNVQLLGELPEKYTELRLQQGSIDISGCKIPEGTLVNIGDEFNRTNVNIGGQRVVLSNYSFPNGYGYEILASSGAEILIQNAQVIFNNGYQGTDINVNCGEKTYSINPHLFGVLDGNDPSIYIGIGDDSVQYEIAVDGKNLPFIREIIEDQPGEYKTHLSRKTEDMWFSAGEDNDPNVQLTVKLPENITVVVESVPVKPEWMED